MTSELESKLNQYINYKNLGTNVCPECDLIDDYKNLDLIIKNNYNEYLKNLKSLNPDRLIFKFMNCYNPMEYWEDFTPDDPSEECKVIRNWNLYNNIIQINIFSSFTDDVNGINFTYFNSKNLFKKILVCKTTQSSRILNLNKTESEIIHCISKDSIVGIYTLEEFIKHFPKQTSKLNEFYKNRNLNSKYSNFDSDCDSFYEPQDQDDINRKNINIRKMKRLINKYSEKSFHKNCDVLKIINSKEHYD